MYFLIGFHNCFIEFFIKLSSYIESTTKDYTVDCHKNEWELIKAWNKVSFDIVVVISPLEFILDSCFKEHTLLCCLVNVWCIRYKVFSREVNLELWILLPICVNKIFTHFINLDLNLVGNSFENFNLVKISFTRFKRKSFDWFCIVIEFEANKTSRDNNKAIWGGKCLAIVLESAGYTRIFWKVNGILFDILN
jgi:hypothetical protein